MCFLNIKACQCILLHQIHKTMIFKKASYDPFKLSAQYTPFPHDMFLQVICLPVAAWTFD